MSLGSVLRLRACFLRAAQGEFRPDRKIVLRMKNPIHGVVFLREIAADLTTFAEIVSEQVYKTTPDHIECCRTIIDLGANIGLASLYFATHYSSCQILAIEPNPDNYELLTANLERMIRARRCTTLQVAVWSAEQQLAAEQSTSPDRYNAFRVRELELGERSLGGIKGLTMQRIIQCSGFDEVDLLKVDIEGAETELFKGDLNWLMRVGSIAIEFHGDNRVACNFDKIVKERGFRIRDEGRHTVLAVREDK